MIMALYAEYGCSLQPENNKTVAYLPIVVLIKVHRKVSIIVQRSDNDSILTIAYNVLENSFV